jgi:hypothetical protein
MAAVMFDYICHGFTLGPTLYFYINLIGLFVEAINETLEIQEFLLNEPLTM